jgi:hypothetical protein
VVWQTAINPVVALELLDAGTWSGAGVLGPEAFDAVPFLDLLAGDYGSPPVGYANDAVVKSNLRNHSKHGMQPPCRSSDRSLDGRYRAWLNHALTSLGELAHEW